MRVSSSVTELYPASTARGPVDLSYTAAVASYLRSLGVVINTATATLDYQHGAHVHSILDLHQNKYRAMTIEMLPKNAGVLLKATFKNGGSEEPFKLTRQVILSLIKAQSH